MKKLFIRFGISLEDDLVFIEQSDDEFSVCEQPKNLKDYQIIALMPASVVAWHTLTIAAKSLKQKKAAIPFALSQKISQDLDEVYYHYQIKGDEILVGVVAKDVLDTYLKKLTSLNIKQYLLLSESKSLADFDDQDRIIFDNGQVIIKNGNNCYGISADISGAVLKGLNPKNDLYWSTKELAKKYKLDDYNNVDNIGTMLVKHLVVDKTADFLKLFERDSNWLTTIKPFWFSMALLSILLTSYPLNLWVQSAQDEHKITQLDKQMIQIYKRINPLAKNVADPYAQLVAYAKSRANASKGQLLSLIQKLEQNFNANIDLNSIQYTKAGLLIKISSNNLNELENFKNQLNKDFDVNIKASTQREQTTKMTLELKKR